MKKYFLLLILFQYTVLSQPQSVGELLFTELHNFKSGEVNRSYLLYKIPFSNLVFQKEGNIFKAGVKAGVEIFNDSIRSVYRDYTEKTISVDEFELTNDKNSYLQGIIEFSIPSGTYKIYPSFTDINSIRELKSKPHTLKTDSTNIITNPIIVYSDKILCDTLQLFNIANFSGTIPFSSELFSILIPVTGENSDGLEIKVHYEEEVIFNEIITEYFQSPFDFTICNNKVVLNNSANTKNVKFFIAKDISAKLKEGIVSLKISYKSEPEKQDSFQIPVRWINKPNALLDLEKSIEHLKLIESSELIDKLERSSRDNLEKDFYSFWKKYDPTPETEFNELMHEFYKRVDYAELNFRPLASKNGAKSDRGKIYIQFGNPDSTVRFTDEYGRMVETWKYSNPQRSFMFVDKRGNGNFTLVNSQ